MRLFTTFLLLLCTLTPTAQAYGKANATPPKPLDYSFNGSGGDCEVGNAMHPYMLIGPDDYFYAQGFGPYIPQGEGRVVDASTLENGLQHIHVRNNDEGSITVITVDPEKPSVAGIAIQRKREMAQPPNDWLFSHVKRCKR